MAVVVLAAVGGAAASAPPAPPAPPGSPPAEYEEARASVLESGRAVVSSLASGDADRLFALFTPEFGRALPLPELRRLTKQMLETAPLERRIAELALPLSASARLYSADYAWGDTTLGISASLTATGQVASLLVEPRPPLPPDPRARYRERTRLRLPFSGEWWTIAGGNSPLLNHHASSRSQRHAVDFVIWRHGGTHRGDGAANEQYWAWGKPVLAPASATVVATHDGVADNRPGATNERAPAGNYVVLAFGNREFALLAHFRRGSIRVHRGDAVAAGSVLGAVGNSGNSSEPHLHIHLQDRAQLSERAVGLPLRFVATSLDGRTAARVAPVSGRFVQSLGP